MSSPPAEEDAQVLTPLDVLTEDLLPSSETDPLGAFLAGKRAFLAKSVEDILGLIYEREELLRQNLCAIDRDETKTRLHFYEIEHWMTRRLDPQVEKLRGNLERDLLNLAKDRRAEEVACWRDTTRLRTDLRDSLREAWREKQRQDLLGEQR